MVRRSLLHRSTPLGEGQAPAGAENPDVRALAAGDAFEFWVRGLVKQSAVRPLCHTEVR